ncbi:hypothetical protein [Streptomyces sp. MST-110588]|uniref:hypothetical protein n=1 Tax=Streptomyces sp. MST-110588 TaxID=2833628 RepID=UPI001F5D3231|nr:hypothetical protein [Streptomyces sp. MST-110588]UNO40499.1 DUF3995 domain-containing protein [Streptomyces sp. MST-110588]
MSDRRRRGWAYAAFGWLVLSFVWHAWMAVDYRRAMGPDSDAPVWVFLAYDGLVTLMSAVGAVLVLATVRAWGDRIPGWMVRVPLWFGAGLLVVRGVPGLIENITTVTGITPHGLLGQATELAGAWGTAFWTSLAINTYFFIGAVVMVPVAVAYERAVKSRQSGSEARLSGLQHHVQT